jgi:exo-beta-1,3-glucanase (GH17 family)
MQKTTRTFFSFSLGLAATALLALSVPAAAAAPRDTNITFKDPRPFKTLCYSGYRDGQGPGSSEPNETQVREDLVLLKKFTHEIRTYGSGKGTHGHFVPKIADELGLSVHLGIWIDDTYPENSNINALRDAFALIREGHKSIKSVIVGNEFMFRVRNIDKRPVDPAMARLLNYVKMVQDSIPSSIKVTSADTWSDVEKNSDEFIRNLDYVIWHTHPWWENQTIGSAANYVASRYKVIQDKVAKVGGKPLVLGETGWPTEVTKGQAVGSQPNQFRFFKDMQAWAFENFAEYWAFTAFDESWKSAEGPVGAHWGMWKTDRQPLQIITDINQLSPRYMWSENPETPTSISGRTSRAIPSRAWVGTRADMLGRSLESPGGARGRVLTPANGSRGLSILVP